MAANGSNGGVSRRRLPATKPMELPAEEPKPRAARFKVGDRVSRREGKGSVGEVLAINQKTAHVYWGTSDNTRKESWILKTELVKFKGSVVSPDEVIKRQAMQ